MSACSSQGRPRSLPENPKGIFLERADSDARLEGDSPSLALGQSSGNLCFPTSLFIDSDKPEIQAYLLLAPSSPPQSQPSDCRSSIHCFMGGSKCSKVPSWPSFDTLAPHIFPRPNPDSWGPGCTAFQYLFPCQLFSWEGSLFTGHICFHPCKIHLWPKGSLTLQRVWSREAAEIPVQTSPF